MNFWRSRTNRAAERAAAEWIVRQKRGLTADEQDAYVQWLASDPSHYSALAYCQKGWARFDVLAALFAPAGTLPDPDLFALPPRKSKRLIPFLSLPLAAAAAVAIGVYAWHFRAPTPVLTAPAVLTAPCEERVLADGSTVQLNRGAAIETRFTPGERRVRLVRGEAHFAVAKDVVHPFIVTAGGVEFHAVGTAFDVRLGQGAVELLVTEGRVKVAEPQSSKSLEQVARTQPIVTAGQRAMVSLASKDHGPSEPEVEAVTANQMDEWLSWQPQLLCFTDKPLPEIILQLNRRNPVRLVVADPALVSMRLTASLRSDNVDGFVRLLESHFSVRTERRESEILLYRASLE